jgi:hypothetical protein
MNCRPLQLRASAFCIVVSTTASPDDSITTTADKIPTISKVDLLILLFIMRLSVLIVYSIVASPILCHIYTETYIA